MATVKLKNIHSYLHFLLELDLMWIIQGLLKKQFTMLVKGESHQLCRILLFVG